MRSVRKYLIRGLAVALIASSFGCAASWQKQIQAGIASSQIALSTAQTQLEAQHEAGNIPPKVWNKIVDINNRGVDTINRAWSLYWLYDTYYQPEVKEKLTSEYGAILQLLVDLRNVAAAFGVEVK